MNLRVYLWLFLCAGSAAIVLVWNASQLIGAPAKPRAKDLEFVPSAEVLKILSVGNTNTVAKLRWIDGFSYLQLQLDKKDDTLIGDSGASGFERLYEALIELDPKFEPFYNFAIMSEAVLNRSNSGLAIKSAQRGILELPHSHGLWQNLAALIKSTENCNLAVLDGILSRWAALSLNEKERYHVERWKSRLGIFDLKGLEQLEYWCEMLVSHSERSPLAEMAKQTLQQQLNNYCMVELQKLYEANNNDIDLSEAQDADQLYAVYGLDGKLEFKSALVVWGPFAFPADIATALEEGVSRKSDRIHISRRSLLLRGDPYGFPFKVVDGTVQSIGKKRFDYEHIITSLSNNIIPEMARKEGRWPRDLAEVWRWLDGQRLPPYMAQLHWEDNRIRVEWAEKPQHEPWDLRMMATYWLQLLNGKK